MPAYLVVTVQVSDAAAFARYREAINDLESQFGGRYLLRAPVIERLEGSSPEGERVVVMEFPDVQAARDFIASDAYQAAKRLRAGAATLEMRLVAEEP